MQKLDIVLLNKLDKVFNGIKNMYVISNNSIQFKDILIKNNLFFSDDILNKFLNLKLKSQISLLYKNIISKGIDIIKINSYDNYIFVYGNKEILDSDLKKLYMYYYKDMSNYGKDKIKYFCKGNLKENVNICIGYNNIKKEAKNIVILTISNINEFREINTYNLNASNLYIFSFTPYELLTNICDVIFIVEAKYEPKIVNIVDNMLHMGKDILVVPGDVWDKSCFFSNFLIKEGAAVILSINDINLYL